MNNCESQIIDRYEEYKKDTFFYDNGVKLIFFRDWEIDRENIWQPPKYDTIKLIHFIRFFLDSTIKEQIPGFYKNTKISIIASTVRAPWNLSGFAISLTVNGNEGTDFENFRLYRSYGCDVLAKKFYSAIWFSEDLIKKWLSKWHNTLKKKLLRRKLFK
jgi:hypothetical protein